ncbi:hypothetical protein HGI30_21035 [Paenibacillus albicereus]|uniref:Glycosyltransferase RgtA/B/C/D-like domain-containing protein n=1 Tax=Paenibacillus albicereus TaxID=2726185 RepID=A0A6H2H250_9BACL|nr:glycosyltransferase family 39 protein [Paenibacillus albicereus]QJC53761.1 hypothetical protein HGI30_21035 [Paenibacillus albicereus]
MNGFRRWIEGEKGAWRLHALLLALVIGLGAWLRFDFLVSVSHLVSHDTKNYDIMVRQLLEQGVYGYKSTEPNAQVTPGYPLFMAAMYELAGYETRDPYPLIRFVQAGIATAMLGLVYALGRLVAGRGTALAAVLLAAVYPPFVWAAGGVLTETLAAFLLMAYVCLQLLALRRGGRWLPLLAGAALGLTVLTRAEFLPLIVLAYAVYGLWTRDWRRTLRQLGLCAAGLAIALSPWVVRNALTLGELVVTSTQQNPFTAGTYPDKNYADGLVDKTGKSQLEVARERLRVGFSEHTGEFVRWYTIGKLEHTYSRMFYGAGHEPRYPVLPGPWELRNAYHRLLVGAGVAALLVMLRRWRHPALLPAAIVIAMSALRLLFVPEYRYNFTVMPLFIVLDAAAAGMLWSWWRGRSSAREPRTEPSKLKEVQEG